MNIRLSAFVAISLDGYIARLNNSLDWLETEYKTDHSEDYGYKKYISSVDCIVMGRNTFEKVVSFPEWAYQNRRVIVLSKQWKQIPDQFAKLAELYTGTIELLTVELQNQGVRHVYVDGGITIQSAIQNKILNDICITTVPVLLGKGIRLFGNVRDDIELELLNTTSFASGFVQSRYRFK